MFESIRAFTQDTFRELTVGRINVSEFCLVFNQLFPRKQKSISESPMFGLRYYYFLNMNSCSNNTVTLENSYFVKSVPEHMSK